MDVAVGSTFAAAIPDPPGGLRGQVLGARVEVPYTHAIATAWNEATLDPQSGVWTVTLESPIAAGDYLLVWMTPDDPTTYREYVPLNAVNLLSSPGADYPAPDPDQVTPPVEELAQLERTRLVGPGGGDAAEFTESTSPTIDEAEQLVEQARDMVLSTLRPTFDPSYWPSVRRLVALQAALLLEASYHREQLNEGSAQLYRQLFDSQLTALQASINQDLQHQALTRGLEPTPLPAMPIYRQVFR